MNEKDRRPCSIRVEPQDKGTRLDAALCRRLKLSRMHARRLLKRGSVLLNGQAVGLKAKGRSLTAHDRIEILSFVHPIDQRALPAPPDAVDGERSDLQVVAAGKHWVMVCKPPGMAVHPLRPEETGTVLNAVIARHPRIHGVGEGGLRSGVVHRLDRETSGVLLLALDQQHWLRFRAAFRDHWARKEYLAIVHGRLAGSGHQAVDLMITRHRPARVRVVEDASRQRRDAVRRCWLSWQVVRNFDQASLVKVHLKTGFLHQARVMLAHLGHSVVGESIYGDQDITNAFGAQRTMLHAVSLQIGRISGRCDPPRDFQRLLQFLERSGGQVESA